MSLLRYTILASILMLLGTTHAAAQSQDKPTIVYGTKSDKYEIGGIAVEGVKNYEDYILIGISGLSVGEEISLPGAEITDAIKRYWKHGLFSAVSIEADSIVDNKVYLKINLAMRPRVSQININGVKKGEQDDVMEKIGIIKGNQLTPNMVDKAKIIIKKFFGDKGFKNTEVDIVQRDDPSKSDQLIVDVNIDKKEKVKVNKIYIVGNDNIPTKKFHGGFFSGGLLKKTNEKGFKSFFKTKKFIQEKYEEDKERVIEKYNELGYRDAYIYSDSVVDLGNNLVDVYINIDEGQKYYLRGIDWVGNSVFSTEYLNRVLQMKKGDVYNRVLIDKRLKGQGEQESVSTLYYNQGYVFNNVMDVERDIVGDSIDLEVRISEGIQASINKIKIYGNTRVYEEVVRRELYLKPGDLFSMDAFKMSVQEIAQMGHFDPEQMNPVPKPDPINGTVDIELGLTPKSSDQIEFSLGWGQTGVIGKVGLKFTNFSMRNLFGGMHRGIIPQGDGQQLEISASTNGSYYQSYSISYMDPWFGRKRPNQFSVGAYFSRQTDISSSYYNSSYYNNYYSMLYGYGNYNSSYYNNYSNYYDPDKYINQLGFSIGYGKRLTWPDNNFRFTATLGYTLYMMKDWEYFLITNGHCNNINLTLSLSRVSIDNAMFPRRGSQISASVSFTPPYSLFDGVDYKNMATSYYDADYQDDMKKKYKWIEYHKWKFNSKFFVPLGSGSKCFVLMTRFDFGLLGSYNKYKKSPFETFYVGGDGMSGYSSSYYSETIGLRGYDNGALTQGYNYGYAYDRMTLELRYPLMLQGSTNIYALAFAEAGNAWTEVGKFNPFDMKRSAGFGVRLFLPMVGMMGIDWAYGFDNINGSKTYGGSQFHFVLGQEF